MERIAYLSLGSNLGNRAKQLEKAIALLDEKCGEILASGRIYETPPIGFDAESNFLNTCVKLKTKLTPEELLAQIKEIESDMGRVKTSHSGYESRLIDIDIVLFDDLKIITEVVEIPHPRFRERLFVLHPLNDIDGKLIDPVSKQTISELLKVCLDESRISVYKNAVSGNE